MEIYSKLIKPVKEVNYLRAENAERYRVIIRYFFQEYENIQYWVYKEEVFSMMNSLDYFHGYTIEKCQNDLDSLVEWGNLTALQDTGKVLTIAEFKNKKYRYQLNEYTVEIERMMLRLENLEIEGASLEPTLLERLDEQLSKFPKILKENDEKINSWWRNLNADFIRLNQDYLDYIRTLNSNKADEMMKSEEFLMFKDLLVTYLRTFVKSLQNYGTVIEEHLKTIKKSDVDILFSKIIQYELSIPRFDKKPLEMDIQNSLTGRWKSILKWFVGENSENELSRLYNITNETIRKITRYAQQIGEMKYRGSNKKQEYLHIANMFNKCENLNEAHLLSSYVFGVEKTFHLIDLEVRHTESIDSSVHDEQSKYMAFEPRSLLARKTKPREIPIDYSIERKMNLLEIEDQKSKEIKILQSYIKNNEIDFATLPIIDSFTRKVLLSWISKAMQQTSKKSKTEFGRIYKIDMSLKDEKCVIKCVDGNFTMPKYKIVFLEDNV